MPQKYPADKAPYDAYDDVAWALPVALGVETKPIEDEAVRSVKLAPVTEPVALPGPGWRARRPSTWCATPARRRCSRRACGSRASRSRRPRRPSRAGGKDYPAGSWIVTGQAGLRSALENVAAELALDFDARASAPDVKRHLVDLPRLALLQTWNDTQSAGWVRMIFDDEKIPYTLIMDEDVRKGGLRERFDVILYPDTGRSLKDIATGIDPKLLAARVHEDAAVPDATARPPRPRT